MFPSDIIHTVPEFIWEMSGYVLIGKRSVNVSPVRFFVSAGVEL